MSCVRFKLSGVRCIFFVFQEEKEHVYFFLFFFFPILFLKSAKVDELFGLGYEYNMFLGIYFLCTYFLWQDEAKEKNKQAYIEYVNIMNLQKNSKKVLVLGQISLN